MRCQKRHAEALTRISCSQIIKKTGLTAWQKKSRLQKAAFEFREETPKEGIARIPMRAALNYCAAQQPAIIRSCKCHKCRSAAIRVDASPYAFDLRNQLVKNIGIYANTAENSSFQCKNSLKHEALERSAALQKRKFHRERPSARAR